MGIEPVLRQMLVSEDFLGFLLAFVHFPPWRDPIIVVYWGFHVHRGPVNKADSARPLAVPQTVL